MTEKRHVISIWFFIGLLLATYGVLILGAGIYDVMYPPAQAPQGEIARDVLANLHAGVWWGALLVVLGIFYVVHFRPGKAK